MRTINLIVIHCSATREDKDFTEYDLDVCHRRRGFNGAGYHFYIRKNGDIKSTRPIEKVGAHAKGFNRESIGICYEGGLDSKGRPKDTRPMTTDLKFTVFILLLIKWLLIYFIMQRYGDKTDRVLLSGSNMIIQKLNYIFSQKSVKHKQRYGNPYSHNAAFIEFRYLFV